MGVFVIPAAGGIYFPTTELSVGKVDPSCRRDDKDTHNRILNPVSP